MILHRGVTWFDLSFKKINLSLTGSRKHQFLSRPLRIDLVPCCVTQIRGLLKFPLAPAPILQPPQLGTF